TLPKSLEFNVILAIMLTDHLSVVDIHAESFRRRTVASFSLLTDVFRAFDGTQHDLLLGDDEKPPEPELPVLRFDYAQEAKRYRRKRSSA
ncbi:hypothetical protein I5U69_23045, partial [Stenotrophomonas maltophilia]|nr:hypothetical protein [Stenotrophomonas maltophilia]